MLFLTTMILVIILISCGRKVDKTKLGEIIRIADAVVVENYTIETVEVFEIELGKAKLVFKDRKATKTDVAKSTEQLKKSIDALILKQPVIPPKDIDYVEKAIEILKVVSKTSENIKLPLALEVTVGAIEKSVKVSWTSNNEEVLNNLGHIKQGSSDIIVILTATISLTSKPRPRILML